MVRQPAVDDATVIDELSLFGARYIPATDIAPDVLATLPQVWIEAITSDPGNGASIMAEAWRKSCPALPRIANLIERCAVRVVLAQLHRRDHWTKTPSQNTEATWLEPGLVYMLRGRFDPANYECFYGWRPSPSENWPDGTSELRSLTGQLFDSVQNGFVNNFASGLLPVEDWHSMGQLPADYVWHFAGSQSDETVTGQRLDFNNTIIPAEDPATWSHVVISPGASNPLYAGFNDNLQGRDSLATEIETLVGEAWGGTDWYDHL